MHVYDQYRAAQDAGNALLKAQLWNKHRLEIRAEGLRRQQEGTQPKEVPEGSFLAQWQAASGEERKRIGREHRNEILAELRRLEQGN